MVLLVENGADIHMTNGNQDTIFLHLIHNRGSEGSDLLTVARVLLDHGADPNEANPSNEAPLRVAAKGGNLPLVELLLEFDAEIDGTDDFKRTALHRAADGGKLETVRVLVEAGADLEIKDFLGKTPLDLAKDYWRGEETAALLAETAANN